VFLKPLRAIFVLITLLCFAAVAQTTPTPQDVKTDAAPLSYGLVVDNSGSLRAGMNHVVEAARIFVEANASGDETFIVRFVTSERIQVLQDFTQSKNRLNRAIDEMYVEGGQTAVIDAVYLAADYLSKNAVVELATEGPNRRRALVLVTDGEDRDSFYKLEQLLALLRDKKIQVFVLGFPEEVKSGPGGKRGYERAVALLNALAKETGGHTVLVHRLTELRAGAAELLKHLRKS
jgi:Ca-activated chloride channel homolog